MPVVVRFLVVTRVIMPVIGQFRVRVLVGVLVFALRVFVGVTMRMVVRMAVTVIVRVTVRLILVPVRMLMRVRMFMAVRVRMVVRVLVSHGRVPRVGWMVRTIIRRVYYESQHRVT